MTVNVTERDYAIELDTVTMTAPVTFAITNSGPGPHAFAISDASGAVLATTHEISRAKTGQLIVPVLEPGEYTYYCPIVGHKREGMVGTLTITP
ncbi:MAG TPA: cupredoxin domain-containing protein [Candidatus Limnocylindrales bacterium]|nr:cupredoxin domain-containing protein [Candidatus Limnocylindrales bacterium]